MGQQPNQVCHLEGGRYLVADVFQSGLLEFDSAGTPIRKLAPIWSDLQSAGWEANQVTLHNDPSGSTCLVALSTGRGFALLGLREDPVRVPYVEAFDAYGVGERKDEGEMAFWATYDAEFAGDTVVILFSGRTADRYRLLDRYNGRTGAYLNTWRLPFKTGEFAAGGGMLFVIDTSGTRIIALRPHL